MKVCETRTRQGAGIHPGTPSAISSTLGAAPFASVTDMNVCRSLGASVAHHAGLYFHRFTALIAAAVSVGGPLSTFISWTTPDLLIRTLRRTVSSTFLAVTAEGYVELTAIQGRPAAISSDTGPPCTNTACARENHSAKATAALLASLISSPNASVFPHPKPGSAGVQSVLTLKD